MTMRDFIKQRRQEITDSVANAYGDNCKPTNDSEREQWVINDEGWYREARRAGVRI